MVNSMLSIQHLRINGVVREGKQGTWSAPRATVWNDVMEESTAWVWPDAPTPRFSLACSSTSDRVRAVAGCIGCDHARRSRGIL